MIQKREIDALAEAAVAHLATHPELAGAFLGHSGLAADALRGAIDDAGFAEAILDFLCAEDERLLEFASDCGVAPARIAHARAALEAGMVG